MKILPFTDHTNRLVRAAAWLGYCLIALLILSGLHVPIEQEKENKTSPTSDDIKHMLPWGLDIKDINVSNGSVLITLNEPFYTSEPMFLRLATRDSTDIFEKLFTSSEGFHSVTVATEVTVASDIYGHTHTETGVAFTMSNQTANRIVWDNFHHTNLVGVADSVYINPLIVRGL